MQLQYLVPAPGHWSHDFPTRVPIDSSFSLNPKGVVLALQFPAARVFGIHEHRSQPGTQFWKMKSDLSQEALGHLVYLEY